MSNRYSPTERIGVSAVDHAVVANLKWIFREQPISDMGIDGHVEPVDDGEPSGRLIGVQIKTGPSHFTDKDDHLVYYGTLTHLEYWFRHSLPVIIVAHLPDDGSTFWAHVTKLSAEKTEKAWKIVIPKAQVLDESSREALLEVCRGADAEVRLRNLTFHAGNMRFLQRGGKLSIYKEEWHNKSLGRGIVRLIKNNEDGSEEIIEGENYWYTGYDTKGLVEAVYPWATASIDDEYYDENFSESFYAVYSDAYIEMNEVYPYATVSGEISLYRLKIELNTLGEAFLEVLEHLEAET